MDEETRFRGWIDCHSTKIVSFLRKEAINRQNRRRPNQAIGYSTVRGYGAACIDLFNQQALFRTNSNPHPRENKAFERKRKFY
jgi:hypothetical protein